MCGDRTRVLLAYGLSAVMAFPPSLGYALPAGGSVTAGSATIANSGSQTTVTQNTSKAVLNWTGFNTTSAETVKFIQPSSSAIAVNRISGGPTNFNGSLLANGNVWLLNPDGMLIGKTAVFNVASVVATTSTIRDGDFVIGNYNFTPGGNPNATITNNGSITVNNGGLAALIAPNVVNNGTIQANLGKVQMASADSYTVDLYGDGLINLQASPAVNSQLVANHGVIKADGGSVTLTAAAADTVVNSLINMDGLIEADSDGKAGSITLYGAGSNAVANNVTADKGTSAGNSKVLVSGTLDASGYNAGEKGGTVQVLGDNVGILSGARIEASGDAGGGTIQIGGDFHGQGTTPTALHTIVQSGAAIKANAVTSGDGGNVTVWADDRTDYAGSIEARGGANSGNGGTIETSGHQTLSLGGTVDASAPHGNAGTWLLDPNNVIINNTNSTSNMGSSPNFGDTGSPAYVNTADIVSALNGGTSVNVTASGSLAVNNSITESTYNGTESLTLKAGTDITLASSVAVTASGNTKLNVTLDSDTGGSGGAIVLNSGSSINSYGGNIIMGGGATPATGYAVGDTTGGTNRGITLTNATISAGSGNITANGLSYSPNSSSNGCCGVELVNSSISTTTGNISLTGLGAPNSGYFGTGVHLDGSMALVSTASGNILINGTGQGAWGTAVNFGVWMEAGATVKSTGTGSGLGSITINGDGAPNGGSYNYGVFLNTGATVSSADANIVITGTGFGATSGLYNNGFVFYRGSIIKSTGSGNITITGTGNTGDNDMDMGGTVNTLGSATGTGTITLIANSLPSSLDSVVQTSGLVVFEPRSASTPINVATGSSGLQITSSILGDITAGRITIGSTSDAAAMNVGPYTWNAPLTLLSGSGNININGAQTMGGNAFLADSLSGNIALGSSGSISSSATGAAITLAASGGNFTDSDSSANALSATAGRWLIYSANPANNNNGPLLSSFYRYSCIYGGSCPAFPASGNGTLYSYTPELSITPLAQVIKDGATPVFSYRISGFLGGDAALDNISGSPILTTGYRPDTGAGAYNITATRGTLTSSLGYGFAGDTASLSVVPLPQTVSISALTAPTSLASNRSNDQFGGIYVSKKVLDSLDIVGPTPLWWDGVVQ